MSLIKIYIYIYVMSHKKDKVEIILFLKTNKQLLKAS